MLDLAHKYEEEIRNRMYDTWYDEKYKFYYSSSYHTPYESPNSKDGDWCCREFVSLDSQHRIIGLISYEIVRDYDLVMNALEYIAEELAKFLKEERINDE